MDVTMPQLGETVTEGTITRWLKQVGDRVEADEPLFEVSTDKVDSEVPAPVAGVVTEILVPEGETVEVGTRLAVLDFRSCSAPPERAPGRVSTAPDGDGRGASLGSRSPESPAPGLPCPRLPIRLAPAVTPDPAACTGAAAARGDPDRLDPPLTSPIVRRLVAERGLDARSIQGSGPGGRLTRKDVLDAAAVGVEPTANSRSADSAPRRGCDRRDRTRH